MNRVLVALTFAGISAAAIAGANGCSAPPEERAPSASTSEAITITCKDPFTTYSPHVCYLQGSKPVCGPGCMSVASAPTPIDGGLGQLPVTATPIAPPPSLASQGCTWGLALTGAQLTNIWACPSANVVLPTTPDLAPAMCSASGEEPDGGCDCETVTATPKVTDNPYVGEAISPWTFVIENVDQMAGPGGDAGCGDHGGGGCVGGCAFPRP